MSKLIVPQDIRKLSRQRALKFHRILNSSLPNQIEPGQIWSTRCHFELPDGPCFETDEPRLVVILHGTGHPSEFLDPITAAPVSLSIPMATEFDLVVSGNASPLGFDFMVEVWNETPVLEGHLRRFLGKLPDEALVALRSLYTAQLLNENVPSTLAGWVGLRSMGENDPRLAFQEAEVEAVAYLARAATAALALEMTVQESARMPAAPRKLHRVLELPLRIGKLPDFGNATAVAYAAGTTGEEDVYFVSKFGDKDYFTFELLVNRLPPYEVYLIVRQISPELGGRKCVVTVNTVEGELQSMPTELKVGAEIQVGKDPNFNPSQVKSTAVEIV